MPLPTLEKTWQFDTNNVDAPGASAYENYQRAVFRIKEILTGFATNPWVVVASSNGVVANATDNWASYTDIVFSGLGTPHSWIVLSQTGMLGAQLRIACFSPANLATVFTLSPAAIYSGFTSTTTPPAAADEIVPGAGTWFGSFAAPFQSVIHGMQSTDGQCTRIIFCSGGASQGFLSLERIHSPVTGMTNPICGMVRGENGTPVTTVGNLNVNNYFKGVDAGTPINLSLSMESGYNATMSALFYQNQISNEWHLANAGFVSNTLPKTGRHGRIADAWFGSSAPTITDGSTYPSGVSRQFVQFGQLVLPWDGSVPLMS